MAPKQALADGSSSDPRRPMKIRKYTPLYKSPEDAPPSYISLLGLVFGMFSMMMRVKWAAWVALYCSVVHIATLKASESDGRQMASSMMLAIMSLVMNYLQPKQSIAPK